MSDPDNVPLVCPNCGRSMPAGSSLGACPQCLLLGVAPLTGSDAEGLVAGASAQLDWQPPSCEELQRVLPAYEILELVGRGGMGAVYKGRQISLDRLVAIKVLPEALHHSEHNFTQRFKQEARAMARLSHSGIVPVHDFGQAEGGLLYFVMEFIEGTDVARMIAEQGRVRSANAHAIACHVLDALHYAHEKGIIHRDIKPSNIMVGLEGQVKVADFGLAKMHSNSESALTKMDAVMGTPHYVSPEAQVPGWALDRRADIYAVGVMLYQMLTGRLPQGMFEMPSMLIPGMDPRFDQIIARAMRPDPLHRYQTAAEMRSDLDAMLTSPIARANGPDTPQAKIRVAEPPLEHKQVTAPRAKVSPNLAVTLLATATTLAALAIAGWIVWPKAHTEQHEDETFVAPVSKTMMAKERDAALRLLELGVEVGVRENGKNRYVVTPQDLGESPGHVVKLNLWGNRAARDADLKDAAADLPLLEEVDGFGSLLDGRFLEELPPTVPLRKLGLGQYPSAKDRHGCTDDVLRIATRWKKIEELAIPYSTVTDAGLAHLAGHKLLKTLDIAGLVGVTDKSVAVLTTLPALEQLELQHSGITNEGISRLASAPSLQLLAVGGLRQTEGCLSLLSGAPALKKVHVNDLDLSATAARALKQCPKLEELVFYNSPFGPGVFEGAAGWKKLKRLVIIGRAGASISALFAAVAKDSVVEEVDCRSPDAKPEDLSQLANCNSLRSLTLEGSQFTDSCVGILGQIQSLTSLNVTNTSISPTGMAALKQALRHWKQPEKPLPSPDRMAAEWALAAAGRVWIADVKEPITDRSALPPNLDIKVTRIELPNLDDNPKARPIKGVELKAINGLRNLKEFIGRSHPLGDQGLQHLAGIKSLRYLDLHACGISKQGVPLLAELENLEHLDLGNEHHPSRDVRLALDDASIRPLAGLSQLKHLNFYRAALTDAAFDVFSKLPKLEYIEVTATRMTTEGIAAFNVKKPKVVVYRRG